MNLRERWRRVWVWTIVNTYTIEIVLIGGLLVLVIVVGVGR